MILLDTSVIIAALRSSSKEGMRALVASDGAVLTLALRHQITIWTLDEHFKLIQQIIPDLRLSYAAMR